jgi:hypothetical protein
MPQRPHTNTCNAVLSALENIRDMDSAALNEQDAYVQRYQPSLAGWKRGDELSANSTMLLEVAREWAGLYVLDEMSLCDCDARYLHVIARRWHHGHATTAPARVIARITADAYLVQFLTPGPGHPRQIAYRYALGVAPDDVTTLDGMDIEPHLRDVGA